MTEPIKVEVVLKEPIPVRFQAELTERILLVSTGIKGITPQEVNGSLTGLTLTIDRPPGFDEANLAFQVASVTEDLRASALRIERETLFEHGGASLSGTDPHEALLAEKSLLPCGPGQYVFQGGFLSALTALDRLIQSKLEKLGCAEQMYPLFIGIDPLFELNYFETMGQHVFIPLTVRSEYSAIARFNRRNSRAVNRDRQLTVAADEQESFRQILSPTVCFHCFASLAKGEVPRAGVSYTAVNKCTRNEGSALKGLERLQVFTMREGISLGTQDSVDARFEAFLALCKDLFKEQLGLKFRVASANDPFFGKIGSKAQLYQSAHRLKFEVQVYLPYADRYLACGSVNKHLNSMGKAFGIRLQDGDELFSCCIGIGLERLALAWLAQTGQSPEALVQAIRRVQE